MNWKMKWNEAKSRKKQQNHETMNKNPKKWNKIKKNEAKSKKRRKIKKIKLYPKMRQKTYRKVLNQKPKILKNGWSTIESVPEFVTFNTRKLWRKRIFRMSKIVKQYYHHQHTLLAQPTKHMKPQWHSCPY